MKGQKVLFSKESDNWATPEYIFFALRHEFGEFDLDPCPLGGEGGLEKEWEGKVFVNPPYSQINSWMQKCYSELQRFKGPNLIVCLIPARTDTKWFHSWVYQIAELRFYKGRIKFVGAKWGAPFPSMLAIYRRN